MGKVNKETNENLARLVALLPELSLDQLRLLLRFVEFLAKEQKDAGKTLDF